jgi:hypothetical protein
MAKMPEHVNINVSAIWDESNCNGNCKYARDIRSRYAYLAQLCPMHESANLHLRLTEIEQRLQVRLRELQQKGLYIDLPRPAKWQNDHEVSIDFGYETPTLPKYAATDFSIMAAVYGLPTGRTTSHKPPIQSIKPNTEREQRMDRREVIERQLRALQKELAILDRFPKRDPFEDGTVLMFERVFGASWEEVQDVDGGRYTYAALRVQDHWYLTGGSHRTLQGATWGQFTEWLGEHAGEIVVMYEGMSLEAYVQAKENALLAKQELEATTDGDMPGHGDKDE